MINWLLESGFIYLFGAALIQGVGLLYVCWGLWGDRSKGRTRCPKCWYDMRGTVPRLECPECGHDAQQARRLYRTRRSRRRIVIGGVLALLSAYPLVIIGGCWREQSTLRKYHISIDVDQQSIGPAWLVNRLPDELARFLDRRSDLVIDDPTKLAACRRLRYLRSIVVSGVTDADLIHLAGLLRLKSLSLLRTQVTDAGLAHLRELSKLEYLCLDGTQVTDTGLVHLKGLSKLTHLLLINAQMPDVGLAHLKELVNLEYLLLVSTQVTDEGLVHLHALSNLKYLALWHTQVTDAGVARLKQALPNLDVDSPFGRP